MDKSSTGIPNAQVGYVGLKVFFKGELTLPSWCIVSRTGGVRTQDDDVRVDECHNSAFRAYVFVFYFLTKPIDHVLRFYVAKGYYARISGTVFLGIRGPSGEYVVVFCAPSPSLEAWEAEQICKTDFALKGKKHVWDI